MKHKLSIGTAFEGRIYLSIGSNFMIFYVLAPFAEFGRIKNGELLEEDFCPMLSFEVHLPCVVTVFLYLYITLILWCRKRREGGAASPSASIEESTTSAAGTASTVPATPDPPRSSSILE